MKTVVLVEDQAAVREMLATVLKMDGGFEIIGECGDGREAYDECLRLKPDLLIVDLMLPGLNGTDVVRQLACQMKDMRILVFSGYQNAAVVRELLQAGAHGFVEKTARLNDLMKGVHTVVNGGTYFGPHISNLLRQAVTTRSGTGVDALSPREREILQMIAESFSTKEVASKLRISTKTAENHRANLMKKLGLHDVASLTRFAIRHGVTLCESTANVS